MKIIKILATVFSALFSPVLSPTYGVALSLFLTYLYANLGQTKFNVIGMTFLLTAFLPLLLIAILYKLRIITDPGLNLRKERPLVYIFSLLCYWATAFYLWKVKAPVWLIMFIVGGSFACIINLIVNYRWKISGHSAGVWGLVALITYIALYHLNVWQINGWLYGSIILAGVTCSSRLVLSRHTLMQVVAGSLNGFVSIILFMTLFS